MTEALDLDVYVQGQRCGRLEEKNSAYTFSYFPGMTADDQVSLTMPPRQVVWQSPDLHPVFQMNLPEGRLREALGLALSKLIGSDDLALLQVLGTSQVGRLSYSLADKALAGGTAPQEDLKRLLEADGKAVFQELMSRHLLHSGISGVQPKVLLRAFDKVALPTSNLIVKAWGEEYPQLAANEFYCMQAAKRAGLQVPAVHLSKGRDLLLVERFDIAGDPGRALGFEDFAVLQGLATRKKYDSSLERCAKTVADFVSPELKVESLEFFFKLCCLNWVLRNGDGHLKNFGILYESPAGLRRMAPAFDLVCTPAYLSNDVPALSLKGSKRWWPRAWIEDFGKMHCQLSRAAVTSAVNATATAVETTLKDLETERKNHPAFEEVGKRMSASWREALAGV